MIENQTITPNSDPWTKATEFDKEFIVPLYNSLVGNITEPIQVADEKDNNGNVLKSHIEWVDREDKDISPIVNKKGGNYLYRQLRLIFSRPAALGNLTNDELVNIVADTVDAMFINLIINDIVYGVDIDKLLMEMPTFLNTFHMYMTSIKGGSLLKFGEKTIGINVSQDQSDKENKEWGKNQK